MPPILSKFGQSISEIFCSLPELRARFDDETENIPSDAIAVFNYV